ncbi:hypothetical protein SAMN06272781_8077 [Streptomyces sp. 1222.2]|uniref:hypothetical protein n=1 Tax=Streptomyces sp. 1222.2 TaxID=1938833 RepID=UPI000BCA02CB|nr:hypothetical protein [Streptomyces sp. 1222.2]SOD83230.1 hypothetical protein SAMN06272781_8077 [Streptomyces sp. 1222.2]
MRRVGVQALAWGAASVWVMTAVVACGHPDTVAGNASPSDSHDSGTYTSVLRRSDLPWSGGGRSPYNAEVKLDDGRRVAMYYRRGEGLVEQHYSPREKAWTEPVVIHRTETDACQGIELRANGGTVAAIADFGPYCNDGEPPDESVAAVGTDSLAKWDIDITKDFDGWERASVSEDGRTVDFSRDITLHWTRAAGFER